MSPVVVALTGERQIELGTWGHRSEAVVAADMAGSRVLPAGAHPRLGETVAVFGLGVVGQLVAQLLTLFLGEEFHHNRVQVVCSQIGGVAPELQHRWDRMRLVHTFMGLAASGQVRYAELVTHRLPVAQAAELYRLIDEDPRSVLQGVLDVSDVD